MCVLSLTSIGFIAPAPEEENSCVFIPAEQKESKQNHVAVQLLLYSERLRKPVLFVGPSPAQRRLPPEAGVGVGVPEPAMLHLLEVAPVDVAVDEEDVAA